MSVARNTRKPETVKADLAERRAAAEKRAKAQIEVLKAEIFLRRCRATAEALEQLQLRTPLAFSTLVDLMAPQPWAIADGVVLGHLLTMEESAYRAAIEDDAFDAVSLDEALRLDWADADEFAVWAEIYTETLREIAEEGGRRLLALREHQRLQQATGDVDQVNGRKSGL